MVAIVGALTLASMAPAAAILVSMRVDAFAGEGTWVRYDVDGSTCSQPVAFELHHSSWIGWSLTGLHQALYWVNVAGIHDIPCPYADSASLGDWPEESCVQGPDSIVCDAPCGRMAIEGAGATRAFHLVIPGRCTGSHATYTVAATLAGTGVDT